MANWRQVGWMCAGLTAATAGGDARETTLATFKTGPGAWQLGTLAVGNIDHDPELEIVVAYRNALGLWVLEAFDYTGSPAPGFPYQALGAPINVSPTLYDVDGDGREEILFTSGGQVVSVNGEDGSVLWSSAVGASNYIPEAGFMAATNGFYLTPAGLFSPTLPATSAFYSEVSSPLVVDANGDGALEVLTAWKIDPDTLSSIQDYNPVVNDYFGQGEWGATGEVWSGGVAHMDARRGNLEFIYHFHQLVESGLAAGQADEEAAQKVYVLNDADSVVAYDRSKPHGFLGKGMLYKQFGQNLRFLSGSYGTGVDLTTVDLDGDGQDEVLVANSRIDPNWQPSATILDDDGSLLWREWHTPVTYPRTHGWFNSATMFAVNPDGDHRVDVVSFLHGTEIDFAYWDGVALRSHPGWPKSFAPRLPSPPVIGDVDGDGAEEFVIGTYDPAKNPSEGELWIIGLDGVVKSRTPVASGVKHIPALADVNRDGAVDVVFRAMDGQVFVRNYGSKSGGAVSWATHRGNMRRDGKPLRPLRPTDAPIAHEKGSHNAANRFAWRVPGSPIGMRIFRRTLSDDAFSLVATLSGVTREHADRDVAPGTLYIYEIVADFGDRTVRSSPFAIHTAFSGNLIRNGGFEADDDAHWDKWFSGSISWEDMIGSATTARSGRKSLEVRLRNVGNNSSVTQFSHYGIPESYLKVAPEKLYSFGGFIKGSGLSPGSEHWFEWDSSKTGEDANPRPMLPWPNYFTPAARFEGGDSEWIYANRVFVMPDRFPNVQLRHRFRVDAPVTGSIFLDDVFFRELPLASDTRWKEILPFGAMWRWATEAPEGWQDPNFNDAHWESAPAKFGAGSVGQNVRTSLPTRLPAYYFRTEAALDSTEFSDLLLSATCTDEYGGKTFPFKLFINGSEIVSSGIEAVSGEGNLVKYFDLTPFVSLLKRGENQIAVLLANDWQPTWDNIAFDLRLQGWPAGSGGATSDARFEEVRRLSEGGIELRIRTSGDDRWSLQWSEGTSPFRWRELQAVEGEGTTIVVDSGQNHSQAPGEAGQRYYRLMRQ